MNVIKVFKDKYNKTPSQVRASLWFVVCGFFQRGISTLTTPIFTRLLTTSEYGEYSTFNSWLEIITIFATLRLGFGVFMQGCVKFEEDRKQFSSALLSLATTWWMGAIIIYLAFQDFWNRLFKLSTFEMLCMFGMMLATIAFNFWSVLKRVDFDYVPLVKLTLIVSVLKPLLGIMAVLLFPGHKVEARIASLAIVEIVCYGGLFLAIKSQSRVWYHKRYWRYALGYNIPLIPHFLSQTVLNQSDRIMIKSLVGSEAAGIYSLAYSISMIMSMVNTSIQNSFNPWIFKQIKAKKYSEIAQISYVVLGIVAFMNFALICIAPEVIAIFAPASYHEAVYVIPPVAMGCYFLFMYCLFSNFELYQAKTVYMTIASVFGAGLNLVLNYFFIQRYGYLAAAYTTLICYIVYTGMHYIFMRIICKKFLDNVRVYNLKIIIMISIVFVVAGIIMMCLYDLILIRYGILLMIIIIAFVKRKNIIFRIKPLLKK